MIKLLKYAWPSIIIASIIFYLSCLMPTNELPSVKIIHADKIVHFIMYFGLSIVSSIYYIYKKKGEIIVLKLILFAILLPILYGGLIEILQYIYFGRTGDWLDFAADSLGSITALPISLWCRKQVLIFNQDNQ